MRVFLAAVMLLSPTPRRAQDDRDVKSAPYMFVHRKVVELKIQ